MFARASGVFSICFSGISPAREARSVRGEHLPGAALGCARGQKLAIVVGSDADNTGESSLAYAGGVPLMEQ